MSLRFIVLIPLCWSLLSVPLSSRALAQEPEEAAVEAEEDHIETDRDSFTRSPRVVERHRCVLEGSYTFLDQAAEYDGHLYPDLLLRYGALDWLEFRLGWTPIPLPGEFAISHCIHPWPIPNSTRLLSDVGQFEPASGSLAA